MTGSPERTAELHDALAEFARQLETPEVLANVDANSIDSLFIPGGSGPMEDLYKDADLGRLLNALDSRDAYIATACHGPSPSSAHGTRKAAGPSPAKK